jgi:hypothetical protein
MSSPSSPHDVTDETIIAEEEAAHHPAQQLDESSPPPPIANNEEAAEEEEERPPGSAPAAASEPGPEPEPGGGPTAPTKDTPPPPARSRAKSPSVSAGGGGGKRGGRGGGRGDAAAATTATTATARPPPEGDDHDDDDDAPEAAAANAAACASSASSPIPFSTDEYPQLELDDSVDHAGLATAFRRPLFGGGGAGPSPACCSIPLTIAYSHLADAMRLRRRAVRRRNATSAEYESVKSRYLKKKVELSMAESELGEHDRKTGAWTRKVFDLELEEPCEWRDGYERLRKYREERGRLPPSSVKKARDEEERSVSDWLHRM